LKRAKGSSLPSRAWFILLIAFKASCGTCRIREAIVTGEPVIVHDTSKDTRLPMAGADTQSLVILPLRFGTEVIGTLELEHHKRHMYRARDLAAMATLAGQVATAIHIAELRRPLVTTVDSIGAQVGALSRATLSLHDSADALTRWPPPFAPPAPREAPRVCCFEHWPVRPLG